jgi:predicted PurR-regulated permease PerM
MTGQSIKTQVITMDFVKLQGSAEGRAAADRPSIMRSLALGLLVILAIAYTLYFAAPILIPVTLAIYLNLLLSPVVWALRKRIPPAFSALVLVALLVGAVATALALLGEPAREWMEKAPAQMRALNRSVAEVKEPLKDIQEISEKVQNITEIKPSEPEAVQKVTITEPDLMVQLVERLPTSLTSIAIVIFLTFFLLAGSGSFGRKFTRLGRNFGERRRIVLILHEMQFGISRYLITITGINVVLGMVIGGVMYFMGFADPWLWGVAAAVLNFIPYIGPLAIIVILGFVGITTYPDSPIAFIAPLLYLALTTVEGQVITPLIVGRRLELSPVAVFLALVFWGWIWGIVGMFLAIPILVGMKIVLDKTPGGAVLASLLSK